ncbi:MAG TPA: hypothetical protein PKD53_29820 [Chloroflexaceae bacterium]|nr:hypothetical protein [Chloroflexaceae bacterium]
MKLLNRLLEGLRQLRPSLRSPGAHIRRIALSYLTIFLRAVPTQRQDTYAQLAPNRTYRAGFLLARARQALEQPGDSLPIALPDRGLRHSRRHTRAALSLHHLALLDKLWVGE